MRSDRKLPRRTEPKLASTLALSTLKSTRMSFHIIAARSGRFNRETELGRQSRRLSQRSSSCASTTVSQLLQPLDVRCVAVFTSIFARQVFVWPILRACATRWKSQVMLPQTRALETSSAFGTFRHSGWLRHCISHSVQQLHVYLLWRSQPDKRMLLASFLQIRRSSLAIGLL